MMLDSFANVQRALLVMFFAFFPALTAAAEPEFYSQCRKFLPRANDFAKKCEADARPFARTFYPSGGTRGELESYSAYFDALEVPSHFVLGCILNFKHQISFVGLYYAARPLDLAHFNEYPIRFIDPNDDVGLQIDGVQHTLIAVRQFQTDAIPPRLKGAVANCEDAGLETINGANATAIIGIHFRKLSDHDIEVCFGDSCRVRSFAMFFGPHDVPVIYALRNLILIDGNGTLLIEQRFYDTCQGWKSDPANVEGITYEVCSQKTDHHN